MTQARDGDVPEGAAVFPLIPAELGIHPLLLGVLHATVFLAGSDDEVVNADAAVETIEYLAAYLQRLEGPELERVRADMECLADYGRREKWPRRDIEFLRRFLADCGVGEQEA
jgi:hypothetical protein